MNRKKKSSKCRGAPRARTVSVRTRPCTQHNQDSTILRAYYGMNKKKLDKGMIFFQVGDLEKKTETAAKVFGCHHRCIYELYPHQPCLEQTMHSRKKMARKIKQD